MHQSIKFKLKKSTRFVDAFEVQPATKHDMLWQVSIYNHSLLSSKWHNMGPRIELKLYNLKPMKLTSSSYHLSEKIFCCWTETLTIKPSIYSLTCWRNLMTPSTVGKHLKLNASKQAQTHILLPQITLTQIQCKLGNRYLIKKST